LQAALRRLAHLESVLAETATTCEQQRVEIDKLKEEIELGGLNSQTQSRA
jgi:hypothetical protein